ncbi:hypothetical protein GGI22_007528, partial [Coemansia erecta]
NRGLKGRLDELERENRLLKQRNFDLSMRYGRSAENRRQPFDIVFSDSDLEDEGCDNTGNSDTSAGRRTGERGHSRNSVHEDAISFTPNNRNSIGLSLATTGNSSISSVTFSEAYAEGSTRNAGSDTKNKEACSSYSSVGDSATDSGLYNSHQEASGVQARYTPSSHDVHGYSRNREEQRLGTTNSSGGGGTLRRKEAKQLKCYAELDGHEGAIYSTQYSPSGSLVASASFDKSVRVWDISEQKQIVALDGHHQTAFDVAWRYDSAAVVSAGFDRMCIEWDLEAKQTTTRLQCDGLVQCVRYSTHNHRIVYSGDSSGFISIHDLRQPQGATKLSNDGSMVNTIYCFNDETRLVSGDRNGEIKMWDVRIGRFMRL